MVRNMFKINNKDSSVMTSFALGQIEINNTGWFLDNIYLLKVNNRDSRITCEICKVDYKYIRTSSMTSFWCLYC